MHDGQHLADCIIAPSPTHELFERASSTVRMRLCAGCLLHLEWGRADACALCSAELTANPPTALASHCMRALTLQGLAHSAVAHARSRPRLQHALRSSQAPVVTA